jgi:creatinine amidohydrolase
LGTDHLLAEAVAKAVGDKTKVPVTPVTPVGISKHHRHFTGSLWVTPEVFRAYMLEVALGVSYHGTTKIVYVNGHGGNTSALLEVCENLRRDYDIFACVVHSYTPNMSGHAGEGETSQNLYFHPHLVDMSKAINQQQNTHLGPFEMSGFNSIGPANFPWDTLDITDSGIMGPAGTVIKTTEASEEKGRAMMEPHIKNLVEFIEVMKTAELSTLLSKPNK